MSKFQKAVWKVITLAVVMVAGYSFIYLVTVGVVHVLRGMGY